MVTINTPHKLKTIVMYPFGSVDNELTERLFFILRISVIAQMLKKLNLGYHECEQVEHGRDA